MYWLLWLLQLFALHQKLLGILQWAMKINWPLREVIWTFSRTGIHLSSVWWWWTASLKYCVDVHSLICLEAHQVLGRHRFSIRSSTLLGLGCVCFYSAEFSDFDNDPDWLWKHFKHSKNSEIFYVRFISMWQFWHPSHSTISLENIQHACYFSYHCWSKCGLQAKMCIFFMYIS